MSNMKGIQLRIESRFLSKQKRRSKFLRRKLLVVTVDGVFRLNMYFIVTLREGLMIHKLVDISHHLKKIKYFKNMEVTPESFYRSAKKDPKTP